MNISKDEILKVLVKSNNIDELDKLRTTYSTFDDFNSAIWGGLIVEKPHYAQEDFNTAFLKLEKNFCIQRLIQAIDIKINLIESGAQGFSQERKIEVSGMESIDDTFVQKRDSMERIISEDLPSYLKEALSHQDLVSVKVSLLNLLLDNSKSTEQLQKIILLIQNKVPEIFQKYTEDEFSNPLNMEQSQWLASYFHEQNLSLETNFSLERYQHLLDVREYLRVNGDPNFQYIEAAKEREFTPVSSIDLNHKSGAKSHSETDSIQTSWLDELINMLVESLRQVKSIGLDLVDKVKSRLK